MSKFWTNWLQLWCVAIMLFGVILAASAIEGLEGGARLILTLQNPDTPPVFNDVERFAFGLMGAVTIGWGLTLLYFFHAAQASHLGDKMYRQAFLILIIWNVIDGYVSFITGFGLNIISNLILSLGLFIPLYVTGKLRF